MIAEIYGKLSSTGSNLSERLEDQLTGNVFGALRYIDFNFGLIPILTCSYFLTEQGDRFYLNFESPKINHNQIRFWPRMVGAEPDLSIELIEHGNRVSIILMEVKYYSGLSSDDMRVNSIKHEASTNSIPINTHTNNFPLLTKSYNQLIRQMRSMQITFPKYRRIQIYLTTDIAYPSEDLSRVRKQANSEGLTDIELYWLSWHDLPKVLKQYSKGLPEREKIVVSDLLMLFERKGFGRFSTIDPFPQNVPKCFRLVTQTPYRQIYLPFLFKLPYIPKSVPSHIPLKLSGVQMTKLTFNKEVKYGK